MSFNYFLPTKIVFGQPAIEALRAELAALEAKRVLLVSDAGLANIGLVDLFRLGLHDAGRDVAVFADISTNPTTDEVAAGLDRAQALDAQALVALGGGSAIDVAKAIAMLKANGGSYADYQWGGRTIGQRSLPLLAVPTTAGTGSEVTKVAVIVDPERPFKKGVLNPLMFPHAAIIDPALTRSLPSMLTAATGMDAFIHALEAYTGRRANPYTDQFALTSLETAWRALPRAVADGNDMQAREAMMLAALWGGTAMDHAGLGLIHALSGPLTGVLHLHHGLANALILPHALRFNLSAIAPERLYRLSTVFGLAPDAPGETFVETLIAFVQSLGLPARLAEAPGLSPAWRDELSRNLAGIVDDTLRMAMTPNNPRPVDASDVEDILTHMMI